MRERLELLFDDNGRRWKGGSPELWRRFNATPGDYDLTAFVVRNCGWVCFRLTAEGMTMQLRPARVSQQAFAAGLYFLADLPPGPIALGLFHDGHWDNYEFASKGAAIEAVIGAVREAQNYHRFASRRVTPGSLGGRQSLRDIIDIWHETQGRYDRERFWRLLGSSLAGRYLLLQRDQGTRSLVLREFGPGFGLLRNYWSETTKPRYFEQQPDSEYGLWAARSYHDALRTGRPVVEQIDCDIRWPQEGLTRHRYWRVIAPLEVSDGSTLLLGATLLDDGISLRGGGGVALS